MTTKPAMTMRERNELKRAELREETRLAIAEGRVTVRQMTAKERREADLRHAACQLTREKRASRFAR